MHANGLVKLVKGWDASREIRAAFRSEGSLDFAGAAIHEEKAGFELRVIGREAEALVQLRRSSEHWELAALLLEPFIGYAIASGQMVKYSDVSSYLRRAIDTAESSLAGDSDAEDERRFRRLKDRLGMVEDAQQVYYSGQLGLADIR